MSYQTYITDAIVVGSYASNTADKSYRLFTERAGMLYATARSVREERSKQRFALQDFSHITVTLVKGKSGWRIGSVEVHENFFMRATTRAERGSIVKLAKVLRRYVQGESPEPTLYTEFLAALTHLTSPTLAAREAFELCTIVRLLTMLGYVAPSSEIAPCLIGEISEQDPSLLQSLSHHLELVYRGAQAVSHLESI